MTLNGQTAGTNSVAGVETLNIVSSGSANTITTLTAAAATTINISGDQTFTLTNANTVATNIASTNTAGVTLVSNNAAATTVTGGSGNDTITFTEDNAAANSVDGGIGNDRITFTANLDIADTVVGGNGTDTLVALSGDLAGQTYTTISGIENLTVSDELGGNLTTADIQAGIEKVTLAAALAANRTVTLEAGSKTVTQTATQAATLTVSDTGSAITDTLTLDIASTVGAVAVLDDDIVVNGFETININSSTTAAQAQAIDTITVTPDVGGAVTINISGNNSVSTGVITVNGATGSVHVDASGLTGTRTFTNVGATVGVTKITGTANADTLVGSATATTLIGGGGIDNITGGEAADSIDGGAGNDVIAGAGGNDVIVAGDGNDTVTDAVAGSVNVDLGSGDDVYVTTNALLTAADTVVGGIGTDRLNTATAITTGTNGGRISGFETLRFTDTGQTQNMAVFTNNTFTRVDSMGAALAVTNAASTLSTLGIDVPAGTTSLARLVDTSADSLTVVAITDVVDGANNTVLTLDNEESLTLDSSDGDFHIRTLNAADLTSLTLTGDNLFNIETAVAGNTDLATINASGVTGTEAITVIASGSTVGVTVTGSSTTGTQTYTTGSGNDRITGGATTGILDVTAGNGADTIVGNAGADVLRGGGGIDSITGGESTDSITGGTGSDIIILTETVAAADVVVMDSTGTDSITGFAYGAAGDQVEFSLAGLELAYNIDFANLDDGASTDAGEGLIQEVTADVAAEADATFFVLVGSTFDSTADVENALETGDFEIGVSDNVAAGDGFIVVYSDGVDAYVAVARVAVDGGADIDAGDLTVTNVAKLVGNASLTAGEFNIANFDFIA
jgi:hypothetical protein